MSETREPARVESVTAGVEPDHGILTSMLHMTGRDGGWGQGFGGLCLKPEHLDDWKAQLCTLFRVATFDEIKGRDCFVLRCWAEWGAEIEGIEVDGRRFTLTDFRRRHWPEQTKSPLEAKRERLLSRIESNARQSQDLVRSVNRLAEGYADWSSPTGSAAPKDGG